MLYDSVTVMCDVCVSVSNHWPRAGSEVVRIDPLRFLAGCRKR